jgi:hypothetical protein
MEDWNIGFLTILWVLVHHSIIPLFQNDHFPFGFLHIKFLEFISNISPIIVMLNLVQHLDLSSG